MIFGSDVRFNICDIRAFAPGMFSVKIDGSMPCAQILPMRYCYGQIPRIQTMIDAP